MAGKSGRPGMRWVLWVLRWVGGGIFIYAGGIKLADLPAFLSAIESFRLFPYRFAVISVYYVPWLEILAGFALLNPLFRRAGGIVLVALVAVFVVLKLSAAARGIDIQCGCFGVARAGESPYLWYFVRDAMILLLLSLVLRLDVSEHEIRRGAQGKIVDSGTPLAGSAL